jgi:hypothetical protein
MICLVIPYSNHDSLSISLLLTHNSSTAMPLKLNIGSVFAAASIPALYHLKIHYALVQAWLANGFHFERTKFHPTRDEHSMPKGILRTVGYVFLKW